MYTPVLRKMPPDDSEGVKKEEAEYEGEKSIGFLKKKKSRNGSPKGVKDKKYEPKEVKKEENDETTITGSSKTPVKKQKKREEEPKKKKKTKRKGAKEAERNVKKREKKVFDLPGQKRETPGERDPLRIFYETLYKQVPNSEMAAIWMMESGLLPKEVAKKVFEKNQRKAQQQKPSSPTEAVVTVERKVESVTIKEKTSSSSASKQKKTADSKVASKQSKKRKKEDSSSEEESDDDFVEAIKPKKKRAT